MALALDQLKSEDPTTHTVLLRRTEEKPYADIQAELGLTTSDINNRIRKAKRLLAEEVARHVRSYTTTPEDFQTEFEIMRRPR